MRSVHSTVTSPIFLKATSLILGFMLWSTVSNLFTQSIWVTIPLCYYNKESKTITGPETIAIELTAKRTHIRHIQKDTLAAHIDAESLHPGANRLAITRDHLLMPQGITVTTVIPHTVVVHVQGELS